jgi:ribosomal protein L20A (L18A)
MKKQVKKVSKKPTKATDSRQYKYTVLYRSKVEGTVYDRLAILKDRSMESAYNRAASFFGVKRQQLDIIEIVEIV